MIEEQTNLGLVTALIVTVGANGLLAIITPKKDEDGVGQNNFVSHNDDFNSIILICYSVGTVGFLLAAFGAVFMVMAVNEVSGDVENVPILLEWVRELHWSSKM